MHGDERLGSQAMLRNSHRPIGQPDEENILRSSSGCRSKSTQRCDQSMHYRGAMLPKSNKQVHNLSNQQNQVQKLIQQMLTLAQLLP